MKTSDLPSLAQRLVTALEIHHHPPTAAIQRARQRLSDELAREPDGLTETERNTYRDAAVSRFEHVVARLKRASRART